MMVEILDPKPGEKIIDPACGSGGFSHQRVGACLDTTQASSETQGLDRKQLFKRESRSPQTVFVALTKIRSSLKSARLTWHLLGMGAAACSAQTLSRPEDWNPVMRDKIGLDQFDVILTNPPFGKKIVIKGAPTLSQYDFGHKWIRNKETKKLEKTTTLHEDQPPQILFLERCLQFLKPGGTIGYCFTGGRIRYADL